VVDVTQSDALTFDKISTKDGTELFFRFSGNRTKNIQLKNTDLSKAKEKTSFELGADAKELKQL